MSICKNIFLVEFVFLLQNFIRHLQPASSQAIGSSLGLSYPNNALFLNGDQPSQAVLFFFFFFYFLYKSALSGTVVTYTDDNRVSMSFVGYYKARWISAAKNIELESLRN